MEENKTILIDSHVHIHSCFDIREFFRFAVKNFEEIHNDLKLTSNFVGVLFLTESTGINYFREIFEDINHFSDLTGLQFEKTMESKSIRVRLRSNNHLLLISGEQIITSENLEILSCGTTEKLMHKQSLKDSIEMIKDKGAIPIIPWGAGKWLGKRGKVVKDVVNESNGFFLGDNSGRPVFWPTPNLFKAAVKKNILIFRGSDPLGLKCQEKKAGSFGFYLVSRIDLNSPFYDLKNMLFSVSDKFKDYGHLENPVSFFKNQFMLRLQRKRNE